MNNINQEFTFFWGGPLSQWYGSSFIYDEIYFNCCEQFMMYYKAKLFNDEINAKKILNSTSPKEIKHLGRKVKDFKDSEWDKVKEIIVFNGNSAKFSQSSTLMKYLKNTKGILVEASPYDKIWGIGLSKDDAQKIPPEEWPGKNLLGLILTRVRDSR